MRSTRRWSRRLVTWQEPTASKAAAQTTFSEAWDACYAILSRARFMISRSCFATWPRLGMMSYPSGARQDQTGKNVSKFERDQQDMGAETNPCRRCLG